MRKKIYSILTAVFILFACMFASACGDKYKNLEFKISYAYDANATEWIDATDGVSFNYGGLNDTLQYVEGEGVTVYFKVEILNTNAKDVGTITVSPAADGISVNTNVKANEVFAVKVSRAVNTTLNFYENNSRKQHSINFGMFRSLESISVDTSVKPGVMVYGSISLPQIKNDRGESILTFNPKYETNQTDVKYSIQSIGGYIGGVYQESYGADIAQRYATISNGVLQVVDGGFLNSNAYIFKIRATSVYHDGSVVPEDLIYADFDVYVVEAPSTETPYVTFVSDDSSNGVELRTQVNLYENGGKYSSSELKININQFNSLYTNGLPTLDGVVKYKPVLFVDGDEYDETSAVGKNGLKISYDKEDEQIYKLSIAPNIDDNNSNLLKIKYVIDGLDFSASQMPAYEKEVVVYKTILPTGFVVNDVDRPEDGDILNESIFGISNQYYDGLNLKLAANHIDNASRKISLSFTEGLVVTSGKNTYNQGFATINTGSSINVKFKDGVNTVQELQVQTLKYPEFYNEQVLNHNEFITITYRLTKIVTAENIELFSDQELKNPLSNMLIKSGTSSELFVKVSYKGTSLQRDSITLASEENISFGGKGTQIKLNDSCVTLITSQTDATTGYKYDIYSVPVAANSELVDGEEVEVYAGNGNLGVNAKFTASVVKVLENPNSLTVKPYSNNIISWAGNPNNFAIARGSLAVFDVVDEFGKSDTIHYVAHKPRVIEGLTDFSADELTITNQSPTLTVQSIKGRYGTKTEVIDLEVFYYAEVDGVIQEQNKNLVLQIAVYETISSITETGNTDHSIGYINNYFEETKSTEISFVSNTVNNVSPTTGVVFYNGEGVDNTSIGRASQIRVAIKDFDTNVANKNISIKYEVGQNTYIDLTQNRGINVLSLNGVDFLNGKILVELTGEVTDVSSIELDIRALRFGQLSNASLPITIPVLQVDKAETISIFGDNLVSVSDNQRELKLSFMGVNKDDYVEKSFEAKINFASQSSSSTELRFDNIETALTYLLYKYKTNPDGSFATNADGTLKYEPANSELDVDFNAETNSVKVRAYNNGCGGTYKLVLATKDSYTGTDISKQMTENDFTTTRALTVVVSDGKVGSAYEIAEVNDLKAINADLTATYKLVNNITIKPSDNFVPIGIVGQTTKIFTGNFDGKNETIVGQNGKTAQYSITYAVDSYAVSTDYGNLAGLFAILGNSAVVKNLKLNVTFDFDSLANYNGNKLYVGALAGVNNGLVENVDVNIASTTVEFSNIAGVDLGGLVSQNLRTGIIKNCAINCVDALKLVANVAGQTNNIGLVTAVNQGLISGRYQGKESLNELVFDVVANLEVVNGSTSQPNIFNVGAVAGSSTGSIENILVGGNIVVSATGTQPKQGGFVGGIAGVLSNNAIVNTSAAISLNLVAQCESINVGGIAGELVGSYINDVRFLTAKTDFGKFTTKGQISGKALVAGIAARTYGGSISKASIESFVKTETKTINVSGIEEEIEQVVYTISGGTTTAGLVANVDITAAQSTTIDKSFVDANISGKGIVLPTATKGTNTYFIGMIDGEVDANNIASYIVVNGKVNGASIDISDFVEEIAISADTTIWTDIYYTTDENPNQYIKASKWVENVAYYRFKTAAWINYAYGLVGVNGQEVDGAVVYTSDSWELDDAHNIVKLNGISFYFPYIVDNGAVVMIEIPQSISSAINAEYITSVDSMLVNKEYIYDDYKIVHKGFVNYYKELGSEANTYNLINTAKDGEKANGLVDISLLPPNAQGGYRFELMGSSYHYAEIFYDDGIAKIAFINNPSKTNSIVIKCYSLFDENLYTYFVFHTQPLLDSLVLNSTSIVEIKNNSDYRYEINLFSGQGNKAIKLEATNVKDEYDVDCLDILNDAEIAKYLVVEHSVNTPDSKLNITTSLSSSMSIGIKENQSFNSDYSEIVTYTLFLKPSYFGGNDATEDLIELGSVSLNVRLYNYATNVVVDGSYPEITSHGSFDFKAYLSSGFVNEQTGKVKETENFTDGEVYVLANDKDSVKLSFEMLDAASQAEVDRILGILNEGKTEKLKTFADLFNYSIYSEPYIVKEGQTDVQLGYIYTYKVEMVDDFNVRYLADNIKFKIVVTAVSNPNKYSSLQVLIKPTGIKTANIRAFVVEKFEANDNVTNIVEADNLETSIIVPGRSDIFYIDLDPAYANVTRATLTSSEIDVPNVGKVKLSYIQMFWQEGKGFVTYNNPLIESQYDGDEFVLEKITSRTAEGKEVYSGRVYVYVYLQKFSGYEDTITTYLNVTTGDGNSIERKKSLLTTYISGAEISFEGIQVASNEYLVQEGTYDNNVELKVFGYQFNSNPDITFEWAAGDENFVTIDSSTIKHKTDGTEYYIGDYVSYNLLNNYDEVTYNPVDYSYTMNMKLSVREGIPAAFKLNARLTMIAKDGQLFTSENSALTFHPTDYILNAVYVDNLTDNVKKLAINKTAALDIKFITNNTVNDQSAAIYDRLLDQVDSVLALFSYYQNGGTIKFEQDTVYHPEFEVNFVNDKIVSVLGVSTFNNLITLRIPYHYVLSQNGKYVLGFEETGDITPVPVSTDFTLDIYAGGSEDNAVPIHHANEIFDATTGKWKLGDYAHYILMNDIELSNVTPITTPIGSFDGNNRVIKIKSFAIDPSSTLFGLFASIGTYTEKDGSTHQTILKNMIVDYGSYQGDFAFTNNEMTNITFGGLVAQNNGGLIYNCDVMNLSTNEKTINVLVDNAATVKVTFGGLVGINSGVITNSRVGRSSYDHISATKTTESVVTKYAQGFTFNILNNISTATTANSFAATVGGFVGVNNGTIATSYVENTSITNYSTNEVTNYTAGFAALNTSKIAYSYVKADDDTITNKNPYATGYGVEHKGNGIVAGFVYNNSGEISNSYANTELKTKSAYIAGFVYNNTGDISESYAACTMNSGNSHDNAEQPFVGVNSNNQLMSSGKITNAYYLMRSETDNPFTQGNKDYAYGLNSKNFQNSENLVGFAFILSNSILERQQGTWSYYTLNGVKRILPELMSTNVIAHSYKFILDTEDKEYTYTNAVSYVEGSQNNPYIIRNVDEYNEVFTSNSDRQFTGYVRFINDIDFQDQAISLKTANDFILGDINALSGSTSVEGNGMTVSGIYLEGKTGQVEESIGLFAEIQNAYIKNLNLEFATPKTENVFSTKAVRYSGGLAGKIANSVIINISLTGNGTILTGSNFVGGLAGIVTGSSLIYSVESNLSVVTSQTYPTDCLYYNEEDYVALNKHLSMQYETYISNMSYAGGLAGVLDLKERTNVDYNVQYVDIFGDKMFVKTNEASISADYAGGIAGYSNEHTKALQLRYFVGNNDTIKGVKAVGGLYGVSLGSIIASQVTAKEDTQYTFDTTMGEFIIAVSSLKQKTLNTNAIGNINLIEGYGYAGGLIGVGLSADVKASYSKVGIKSGVEVGGAIGLSVASNITYSYAIPYVQRNENLENVGGLIGSAYGMRANSPERNNKIKEFEDLLKYKRETFVDTNAQFTFSTIILDDYKTEFENATVDYIAANFSDNIESYLTTNMSNQLSYVYAGYVVEGAVKNQTSSQLKSTQIDLAKLYNSSDASAQTVAFQEVFGAWSIVKYWSLDSTKYFPLLKNAGVDNYIIIKTENDLALIAANPTGKFKVVRNITVTKEYNQNWIFAGLFEGVLIGEMENSNVSQQPVISGLKLRPNTPDETAGLFQATRGATINNLVFEWDAGTSAAVTLGFNITNFGGLSCEDTGSLISNVEVRAVGNDGYLINDDTHTISGFGGLVAEATDTNILSCKFVGKVKATLSGSGAINFGGLVGSAVETIDPNNGVQTASEVEVETYNGMVVMNSVVGAASPEGGTNATLPTTSFDLTLANASNFYIGAAIGYSSYASLSAVEVGGVSNDTEYKHITMTLRGDNSSANIYAGGIVGLAKEGTISSCDALTKVEMTGSFKNQFSLVEGRPVVSGSSIAVGGLAGMYSVSAGSDVYTGVKLTNTYTEIEVNASVEDNVLMVSTGIAETAGDVDFKYCLFNGSVNTTASGFCHIYAGGMVALTNSGCLKAQEVTTNAVLTVGSANTYDLTVGGLVGSIDNAATANLTYVASLGRIVPITGYNISYNLNAGGFVGNITNEATISNSYTISSIVSDGIAAAETMKDNNINALAGKGKFTVANNNSVVYSSDYALTPDVSEVGTNLSATALLKTLAWHKDINGDLDNVWTELTVAGTRLPYLASIQTALTDYGVIDVSTFDYVSGSSLLPEEISSNTFTFKQQNPSEDDVYVYYYLVNQNGTLPKFSGTLNGILFAQDLDMNQTFELGSLSKDLDTNGHTIQGSIAKVAKHSAISNLHVVVKNPIQLLDADITDGTGLIVGYNEGLIFNCSVQGTGIIVEGSNALGLIAARNEGMISYSYSTAEIKQTYVDTAGIVNVNAGKLFANYFTGYIETINFYTEAEAEETLQTSGIVLAVETEQSYLYNNYMAGVIKGGTGENNFIAGAYEGLKGSNNFIDSFSDIGFVGNDVVKATSTANLMKNDLTGKYWYRLYEDEDLASSDYEDTFGYNYGYPVHKFNKKSLHLGDSLKVKEQKNQLYTGTGAVNDGYYLIPHLGVLSSVQALLGESRKYALIYDINGYDVVNTTNFAWQPVGADTDINHFKPIAGFNGKFTSGKYYPVTDLISINEEMCIIENLSKKGLFTNIASAQFTNIILGSFTELENSGALGGIILTNKQEDVDTGKKVERNIVDVDNIKFQTSSQITGIGEAEQDAENHFGGLFGEVQGTLNISHFTSAEKDEQRGTVSVNVAISGNQKNDYAGLIAGKLSGTLNIIGDENPNAENLYYAQFGQLNYAGGLVGLATGGKISSEVAINIVPTHLEYVNVLGGVVGKTDAEAGSGTETTDTVQIANVSVELTKPMTSFMQINANAFGGFVGEVNKATVIDGSSITSNIEGVEVQLLGKNDYNRYYGMAAGLQNAKLTLVDVIIEKVTMMNVSGGIAADSDIGKETSKNGVGFFLGKQNADLVVNNIAVPEITLKSAIANLGTISGYYADGKVLIDNVDNLSSKFILQGSINVGGVFGVSDVAELTTGIFGDAANLFELEQGLSLSSLQVGAGYYNENKANFGGLVGLLKSNVPGEYKIINSEGKEIVEENKLVNRNVITFVDNQYGKVVKNIGGIAGKFVGSSAYNLHNDQTFGVYGYQDDTTYSKNISNNDSLAQYTFDTTEYVKTMNVGGIFGLVEASVPKQVEGGETPTAIISNLQTVDVCGYQNVGGIIGYVGGENPVVISNPTVKQEEGVENSEDWQLIENGTKLNVVLENPLLNSEVHGVLNVGGVVGYAGENTTITNMYSKIKVFGNTSVGGLVGFADNSTIKNNYVGDGDKQVVKGVYYNYKTEARSGNLFIPTSIGGLVGSSHASILQNNIVSGVTVTSATESEGTVISTIENNMAEVVVGSGNNPNYANIVELTEQTIEYNNIQSGYGGFAGTIDGETLQKSAIYAENTDIAIEQNNNYLKNITINAPLGINVGTYYGVYIMEDVINIQIGNETKNIAMPTPYLYGDTKTDGAYNIGGIVGFVVSNDLNNSFIQNSMLRGSANIQLQAETTGMYVGGLIGKTNANTISELNISTNQNVDITLYTDNSYYIGGLIGRAIVNNDAIISGNVGETNPEGEIVKDSITGSSFDLASNVGGLIGMLKVDNYKGVTSSTSANGVSISVTGYHKLPFTINTIENGNYYEGGSRFNSTEENGQIELYAMAYYINLDQFTISASKNVPDTNPLDDSVEGWAKDYTTTRIIQRCIPASQNNGAPWDSIGVVYDAEHIKGVVTQDNDGEEYIVTTVYEEEVGQPKAYNAEYIATAMKIRDTKTGDHKLLTKSQVGTIDENDCNDNAKEALSYLGYSWDNAHNDSRNEMGERIIEHNYCGQSYAFFKEKVFTGKDGLNSTSSSGSIFEVNAYSGTGSNFTTKARPVDTGLLVAGIFIAFVGFALSYVTGGASAVLGVKIAVVLIVGTGVGMMIYGVQELANIQNTVTHQYYIQTVEQSEGYLSSVYYQNIRYENGKIVAESDDYITIGDQKYQPYSYSKPTDYNAKKYFLINAQYNAEGYLEEKTNPIHEYASVGKKEDGKQVHTVYQNKWTYSAQEIKQLPMFAVNGQKANYITHNGQYYIVVDHYVYHQSMYYINIAAVKTISVRTNDMGIIPYDNETQDQIPIGLYYQKDGKTYIHGKSTRDTITGEIDYEFINNYGNFVKYSSSDGYYLDYGISTKYPINENISQDVPVSYIPYMPPDKDAPEPIIDNYKYIRGAYYTTQNLNLDEQQTRYATFDYYATDNVPSYGAEGVDYIKVPYQYSKVVEGETFNYAGYYCYVINSIADTGTASSLIMGDTYLPSIVVAVYPNSFENPYVDNVGNPKVITGAKDNNIYELSETETNLTNTATYFLFVNGFKVQKVKNNIFVYTPSLDDSIYTASFKSDDGTDICFGVKTEGNTQSVRKFDEIRTYWDTIKNKEYQGTKLSDMFVISFIETETKKVQIAGTEYHLPRIYQVNTLYSIDELGYLCRNYLLYDVPDPSSFHTGKYAMDTTIGLYTRYKYHTSLLAPISGWDKGKLVIKPDDWSNGYSGNPNGKTTMLIESVKVCIGGTDKCYANENATPIKTGGLKSK